MRIELVTQPDASSSNLIEFIQGTLRDADISRFVAITAWVNHRGLARLVPELRAFRSRSKTPGVAAIVLGIDEGGATEQGLRLAAAEFDHSYVFSTADDRTFHPKVYLASGSRRASLFVGSNNFTPGGLFFNYEAALRIEIELGKGDAQGEALVAEAEGYLARLIGDTDVCKPLGGNLTAIIADPAYRIRDEAAPRGTRGATPVDPDADGDDQLGPGLFGKSGVPARPRVPPGQPLPAGAGGRAPAPARSRTRGPRPAPAPAPARVLSAAPVGVIRRWFRPLDATAAQHPPKVGSSPTGNIRLTQEAHGIDHTTYFRVEFFGTAVWVGTPEARGLRETTAVEMEVVIDGRSAGLMRFEISHAPWREAGQGNVTTVLHVGPLSPALHIADYTGRVLTIEQTAGGTYRLIIDTVETGPFRR